MVDRSTAPLEMFGEPDDTECPHGIPTGMGVECWECRYDQLEIDYDALEQECGELAERLQQLAAEIAEPSIKELDVLYRIRKAIGDDGKMMQDELVDKIQEIVAENALLGKRLEPIEAAYREYKEYPSSAIVKRDAYDKAINSCMVLKDDRPDLALGKAILGKE